MWIRAQDGKHYNAEKFTVIQVRPVEAPLRRNSTGQIVPGGPEFWEVAGILQLSTDPKIPTVGVSLSSKVQTEEEALVILAKIYAGYSDPIDLMA